MISRYVGLWPATAVTERPPRSLLLLLLLHLLQLFRSLTLSSVSPSVASIRTHTVGMQFYISFVVSVALHRNPTLHSFFSYSLFPMHSTNNIVKREWETLLRFSRVRYILLPFNGLHIFQPRNLTTIQLSWIFNRQLWKVNNEVPLVI